jgi:hypothetical protein
MTFFAEEARMTLGESRSSLVSGEGWIVDARAVEGPS